MNEDSLRSKGVLRKSSRIIRISGDNSQNVDMKNFWNKKETKMSKAMEIFNDLNEMSEEEIIEELIEEFGEEFEEEIRDSFNFEGRYGDWSRGKAGSFTADGIKYNWIINEDTAEEIALKIVKNDLENEPEIFNQDWLSGFIEISPTDKRIKAQEEADDLVDNVLTDEDVLEQAGMEDKYAEAEEAENEEEMERILDAAKEEVREQHAKKVEKELYDPIQYFVHDKRIYSVEDLMKQSFIMIDTDKAAQDAVDTDGWAHFLSLYDGDYQTTKGGIVYFR